MHRIDASHRRIRFAISKSGRTIRYFAPVLLLIAVSACGESRNDVGEAEEGRLVLGNIEEREVAERGVATGGRSLVFQGFHGNIRLDATAGRFADLQFEKIARGDDREAARRLLQDVTVSEQGSDEEFRYVIDSPNKRRTAVDVRGFVPEPTRIHITWESGTISLSGHDGPLHVTNGSGRVEAAGVAGDAEIRLQNGGILLGVADLPSGANIVLETANGDVDVTLPPGSSTQIAAQTAAGDIQTTGLQFTDRSIEPIGAGAEFNGQLGRGSARLRVRTENGTIHLRSGRMTRLPGADTLAAPQDTTGVSPDTTAGQPSPSARTTPTSPGTITPGSPEDTTPPASNGSPSNPGRSPTQTDTTGISPDV